MEPAAVPAPLVHSAPLTAAGTDAAGVKGTVVVNMLTLEVAVEDIDTKGEAAGLKTAHETLLDNAGWKRHYCYGAAVQNGKFRTVSGYINGLREAHAVVSAPGYDGSLRAHGSLQARGSTEEFEAFKKFTKENRNREEAWIPEEAITVAVRLASEGGGKGTFAIDARLQASILEHLASFHGGVEDSVASKEMLERALQINESECGADSREVAITLGNLGNAYGDLGDAQRQKDLLERALAILEREYGAEHREVAITLTNLGNAYGDLGDAHSKKDLLERALAIEEREYGAEHREVAITLTNLGNAYGVLGDAQRQKDLLERALAIQERGYGAEHREVAITEFNLASSLESLGQWEEARRRYRHAGSIFAASFGAEHQYTVMAEEALSRLAPEAAAGSAEAAATARAPTEPPRYAMSRGTAVVVRDLAKRQELNGKSGRITSWRDETRRYGVELEGDEKPVSVRAANLTQLCGATISTIESRPELNGQRARVMNCRSGTYMLKLSNETSGCDFVHLEASQVILDPGTCVVLQGLSKDEYNGKMGTITKIDSDAMRYTVSCEGGKTIKVKFGNVLC